MAHDRVKWILITQIMLLFYSAGGICSKMAGRSSFLSLQFIIYYGILLLILGAYAIGWQQVIKHLPLTTAYANKAMTIVWGIVWGAILFQERLTGGKVIGAMLVVIGVILYAEADHEPETGE